MENLNNIGLDKSKSEELAKKLNILLVIFITGLATLPDPVI